MKFRNLVVLVAIASVLRSQEPEFVKTLGEHNAVLSVLTFSPDGSILVSGDSNGVIKLWSVMTGKLLNLTGHADRVTCIIFSPDGKLLASGGKDGTIRVWDTATGACTHILCAHKNPISALAFSADSQTLVSGSEQEMRFWDWQEFLCQKKIQYPGTPTLIFFIDGNLVSVGGISGNFLVWDALTGKFAAQISQGTKQHDDWKAIFYPPISVMIEEWKEKMPDGKRRAVHGLSVSESNIVLCSITLAQMPTLTTISKKAELVAFSFEKELKLWYFKKSIK